MINLEPRNTQTRVKHEILSRYLDTWGGIIVGGLKSRHPRIRHFVYVDCFAYLGRYAGEKEDHLQNRGAKDVYGSPIIGINSLDKLLTHAQRMGVSISVSSILVEKNRETFDGLKETLRSAGFTERLNENRDFASLTNGQIAVVNADSITIIDELIAYTTRPDTWAFYLLDPRGPSGIPYGFVKKVVSQERHDVMINFIYEDLLRKTGMCLRDDLQPRHKQLVDYWSEAFGGDWWKEIARETLLAEGESRFLKEALGEYGEGIVVSDERLTEIKEQKFVSAYRDVLHSMDPSLVTKLVNLRFGDKERTMFYLYLTTHNPTGALELNRILYDAKYLEYELRYRLNIAKKTAPPPGQLTLIPVEIQVPEYQRLPRPDINEIEQYILKRFTEQTATRREVYRELVNTDYFPSEVNKAIRSLRKKEHASFDGDLKHDTVISFRN